MTSRMVWTGALIQHGGFESNADPKYLSHWLAIWSDFDSNFLNQLILAEDHYQAFGYWPSTGRLASSGWRWPLHVAYRLEARIRGLAAAAKRAQGVLDEVIEDFLLAKLLLVASDEIELLVPWITDPDSQNVYNVPGNQMQHSATAMVQALATLLDFKSAGKWSNALNTYVDDFMPYYPDGTEGEQSFHYNENFLKLARSSIKLISSGSGMPFVDSLPHKGLYRYRFLSSIVRPNDGLTPGEGMANAPLYTEYQEVFNDPLVGRIINMTQNQTGPAPAFESIMFPWSGYHVLRNGWKSNDTHLYLKGGRKGVGHRSASGNAIQLTAYGRTILTRGGRRSYGAGPFPGHNEYQLSSFGYNTIVVDGKSQRNENAPIQPDPIPARWHSCDLLDFAESRYESGYVDIDESITHLRQVVFLRDLNMFVVTDRISSQNQRQYSQIWKFDRAFDREQVEGDSENQILRTLDVDKANLTLHHFSATELSYEKYYGQETPRVLGWQGVEPHYAAVDIHANWQGTGAQQVVTLLRPTAKLESAPPKVEKLQAVGVDGFEMMITKGNYLKYWSATSDASLLGDEETIRVLGEALLIRRDAAGELYGFALGGDELQINGLSFELKVRDFSFRSVDGQLILYPIRSPEYFEWVDAAGDIVPSYWASPAEEIVYNIPPPETPTVAGIKTINFTTAEGYSDGPLVGQDGWSGAPEWSVNTAGGGSATITAEGFRTLIRNPDVGATLNLDIGESITLRTVIQLSGTLATPVANEQIINIGIGTSAITAGFARLYLTTDGNITLFNSDGQNGVGFSIVGNGNARLAIDTTYTVNGVWDSTTTHELINLDTNLSAGTGMRTGWGPTTYDIITGTGDVGSYRQTTWNSANTGITGITMHSTQVVGAPVFLPASYHAWAEHMGLAGEMAEPHADPQGVGVSNLLRYAHGMDLEKILYNRLPRFQFFEGDPDVPPRPGFSFYMIDAEDIRFVVEVSTDLLNWSLFPDSNLHVEKIPAHQGLRHVQVQDLESTPISTGKRFYRIRLFNE